MRKTKFIFFGLLLFVTLNFFLIPLAMAQGFEITKEEWIILTVLGAISPAVIVPLTNLFKKLPVLKSIDGISSVTSIGLTFGAAYIVDLVAKTHLTLANLWFLTLNMQTLSQMVYSMKPNFARKVP